MKLYYITRVNIPSTAAQSVQISSMCEAFSNKKIEFKLISTLNNENINLNKIFMWDRIRLNTRFKYLEFVIKSFFKVLKEKPTHIFTRDIIVAFLLSFLNIKIVYEAHKEPKTKISELIMNFLKNKNNFKLITISYALKKYYIETYYFNEKKVFNYHDGVFIHKYDKYRDIKKETLRQELELPLDKIIVMHTGSLYKGNDALLFEKVIKNFKNILFVQVGGSIQDIKKYKEYYKLFDNIIFIEHQTNENLIKYQFCADLLFYSLTKSNQLWWCTSPLKIFEYMATGIPIICSNIGSVSEVLNENNSIPFNPEDEQSIIDAVKLFLQNKEEVNLRAKKALQDINEKYTWDKRVDNILKIIK